MLIKLGTELTKEEYVTRYMRNFQKLLLLGDRPKVLTNREEQLLQYEKELCVLFYEQFIKKHHRAPDEATLDDQVKRIFYNERKNWHVTIFENMMIIHLGMSVYVLVGHEKW